MLVVFLEGKVGGTDAFKTFQVVVERSTGEKIKSLRSDRGGEYISNAFSKYCEEQGSRRFVTAPYTLQQNGVAERKNKAIFDMV